MNLQTVLNINLVSGDTLTKSYPGLPADALRAAADELSTGTLTITIVKKGPHGKVKTTVELIPSAQVKSILPQENA